MKTRNLMNRFSVKSLVIATVVSAGLVFAGCSKEEDSYVMDSVEADQEYSLKGKPADVGSDKGAPKKGTESIAEIAIGAGFSELVKALVYVDTELNAGLVDLFLNGKDQYTVFAPTNEAFFALYGEDGSIADLDNPQLVLDVLFYHVTEGRRASNSVVPKNGVRTIETLLEATFTVDAGAMIDAGSNDAQIVAADISASNGIIHVIDTVILP